MSSEYNKSIFIFICIYIITSSLRKLCFHGKKSIYYCQSSQNSMKLREMWFLGPACACVCVWFSTFQTTILIYDLKYKIEIWYTSEAVKSFYSWRFSQKFITDLRFYGIFNFLKNNCGSHFYEIFWKFALNFLTRTNIDWSSLNFVYGCTHNRLCFILNLERISRGL